MTFWILFIAFAVLCVYFTCRFRPRCGRHGKPVAISRMPSLGCQLCIDGDVRTHHTERAAEEKARVQAVAGEVLSDQVLLGEFFGKLKVFCENDLKRAERELGAAIQQGRRPGPVE